MFAMKRWYQIERILGCLIYCFGQRTSAWTLKRRDAACHMLYGLVAISSISVSSHAAETVGKDSSCNSSFCLGVWDGLLADCPHGSGAIGAGCVASQDDTPGNFAEPWDYSDDMEYAASQHEEQVDMLVDKILVAIRKVASQRRDQVSVVMQDGRYLRVSITDGRSLEESVGEFYITPDDTTVQFRLASLSSRRNQEFSSFKNKDRAELIRKELRFLKLPILRNRRRSLLFVESDDWDTFGPGSASLGPPAEMKRGALEGRLSQFFDPNLKIDLLQQFPNRQ